MFCNDKDYDNFVFKSGKAAATAYTKVFRKNRELKNKAYLWTICIQYLRILFRSFGEEAFQRFCIKLTMFKMFWLLVC